VSKRRPVAPLDYTRRWGLRLWVGAVLAFLYGPLILLVVYSFNDSARNLAWKGFTFKYYAKAFANDGLMEALGNSLVIALAATLISLVLGTLTAVLLWRFRFPGKAGLEGMVALPIVVPEICMGVAMLIFFNGIGWPQNLPWPFSLTAITIAHVTFCFPFVTMVVRARLGSFNRQMEEAAKDLGASEWHAFRDVLLPHLKPGLVAGALLAFTLSLDDFVITFFTSGPNTVTFPVKVYAMVRFSVTPEVNAVSAMLLVFTVLLTAVAMKLQGVSSAIARGHQSD
jgi:spermidine/putrescine transport system permease protein